MIGKRLKLLREEMGLKQIDIAEMLGVCPPKIRPQAGTMQ